MMNFYDELTARKAAILKIKKMIVRSLAKTPEGSLRISHNGNREMYYWRKKSGDRTGIYLPKADLPTAKALAQKSYLNMTLKSINDELSAIDSYLENLPQNPCENIYEILSESRRRLIEPIWIPNEEYVASWESQEYIRKEIKDDVPEFYTDKDERVRSKSEVIIANELNKAGVPYRYECPLVIHGIKIHPDFTILNVKKRKEIYWEHFGKMDDPDYVNKTVWKKNLFLSGGYYLGDEFICTWETAKNPLNIKHVRQMIKHYCL